MKSEDAGPQCVAGRGTWGPASGKAGALVHLELDGEFVGAEREAGGKEHGTLLLGDRLCALPFAPLDFLEKLRVGRGRGG